MQETSCLKNDILLVRQTCQYKEIPKINFEIHHAAALPNPRSKFPPCFLSHLATIRLNAFQNLAPRNNRFSHALFSLYSTRRPGAVPVCKALKRPPLPLSNARRAFVDHRLIKPTKCLAYPGVPHWTYYGHYIAPPTRMREFLLNCCCCWKQCKPARNSKISSTLICMGCCACVFFFFFFLRGGCCDRSARK